MVEITKDRTMKVLLLENVHKLGSAGDIVEVKGGFGRNFLLPRGMAQAITAKAVKEIEEIKRVTIRRADRELNAAKELGSKLESHTIQLEGKIGARGNKLYGSVTTQAIASSIGSYLGIEVDKRKISLPEAIKTLGMHKYVVKLHPDVEITGNIEVIKRKEQA